MSKKTMPASPLFAPTVDNTDLLSFAQDYQNARQNFLEATFSLQKQSLQMHGLQMGHNHRALSCDGQGPNGESLYTDTLWLGPSDASKTLVLISATHGVEGFAGSAIQIDLLKRLKFNPAWPKDLAILVIHTLNPWGFAWLRRCTEDGIDLNRNFVDFSRPLPVNEGYQLLADAIVPATRDWHSSTQRMMEYAHVHGQRAYEMAVSGGQYIDPKGMFYGGAKPSQARLHIETLMQDYQLDQRQLAVIDLHTGLGPFGYGEIICDHPSGSEGARVAAQWYGDAVTLPDAGTSTSVPKEGLLDYAWHAIMARSPRAPGCFVTLEFGTYPVQNMFEALRLDHWLHAYGVVDWQHPDTQNIKAQIRRQFYPDTAAWQSMVIFQGRQTIDMALRGLCSD